MSIKTGEVHTARLQSVKTNQFFYMAALSKHLIIYKSNYGLLFQICASLAATRRHSEHYLLKKKIRLLTLLIALALMWFLSV
jgi:hypothetical protein